MNDHGTVWSAGKGYGRNTGSVHVRGEDGTPICGAKAKRWSPGPARVSCVKCAAKQGEVVGNADVVLRPGSLLSAKDQRTMHPSQQIRKLRNIARRALSHSDWMRELGDIPEAQKAADKARRASAELLVVAESVNDERLARLR